jgi:medium-chain acyl-[acyl-carrier-protein] hydrolase
MRAMETALSYEHTLTSSEVNEWGDIRLSALFSLYQDLSDAGCAMLGCGLEDVGKKGFGWVISRHLIEISRLPKVGEHLHLLTYPDPIMGIVYPRQFVFYDGEGKALIRMASSFVLIHLDSRRLAFPKETGVTISGVARAEDLPLPRAISPLPTEPRFTHIVRASDIDSNHHMNNIRYATLLNDCHPSSFYQNHALKELTINYLAEIHEGAAIEVSSSAMKEGVEIILGKVEGKEHFIASLRYEEKGDESR